MVDEMDEEVSRILQLDTCEVLLRFVSEWDPRRNGTTKGGYLKGEVQVPLVNPNEKIYMEMKFVPTEALVESLTAEFSDVFDADTARLVANCHPMLIHNVRLSGKTRNR